MFLSVNGYVVILRSSGKLAILTVIYWSLQNDNMHANYTDAFILTMIYSVHKHHHIKTESGNWFMNSRCWCSCFVACARTSAGI